MRLFGGSLFKRTFFAGATTGQQLLYALDEQTRRWEAEGRVNKYEFWEFLWPVIQRMAPCVGIVAQDMRTMQIRAFRADAVVIATGGNGLIFGKSTMSVICTGGAASRCYQAGASYGNPEMIQVHPTAIPGEDKCRLISESARGEGGRVWVPRKPGDTRPPNTIPEAERYYFLEERYPKYGNIVPRDIATREIFEVCQQGTGRGRRKHGLSRPARRSETDRPRSRPRQARRHSGNLRKVRRRRPAGRADEDFPGRPLHHGRPLGRLQARTKPDPAA